MTGKSWDRLILFIGALGMMTGTLPGNAKAEPTNINQAPAAAADLLQAMIGGRPHLDARLRFEHVDEDSTKEDPEANAPTIRTRFGYTTAQWRGLWVMLEAEDVTHIGDTTWYDTTNPSKQDTDPLVADPEGTEINRAFLAFEGPEDVSLLSETSAALGRQRILLDNQRWVGNVGWRQNEQTFDGIRVDNTSVPNTHFYYSYVWRVQRIFGPDSPFEEFEGNFHFLNLSYRFPVGTLTGYGYLLDFDDASRSSFDETLLSSNSFGLRFAGAYDTERGLTFLYAGEWAGQDDAGSNPNNLEHQYYLLEGGVTFSLGAFPVTIKAAYEVLEGDGETSLQTPFATAHAFNGWADKFTSATSTNPSQGLEDLFISLGTSMWGADFLAVFHDYDAEDGSGDFGSEFNLLASRKFGKHWVAGLKYAYYDQDDVPPVSGAFDTEKFWAWVEFKFN